jgi:hypothetical protein
LLQSKKNRNSLTPTTTPNPSPPAPAPQPKPADKNKKHRRNHTVGTSINIDLDENEQKLEGQASVKQIPQVARGSLPQTNTIPISISEADTPIALETVEPVRILQSKLPRHLLKYIMYIMVQNLKLFDWTQCNNLKKDTDDQGHTTHILSHKVIGVLQSLIAIRHH